jgi:hypothetical protein
VRRVSPFMFGARSECPCSAHAAFSYAPYSDRSGLPFLPCFGLHPRGFAVPSALKIREAFELLKTGFSNAHDLALPGSSHYCAAVSFLFQSQDSHPTHLRASAVQMVRGLSSALLPAAALPLSLHFMTVQNL